MGRSGLKENDRKKSLANLALAERFRETAEEISEERKGISALFTIETKKLADALERKDFSKIFELERTFQEHDANFRTPDNKKPKEYVELLHFLAERFEEFSHPENVKENFKTTLERLKKPSGIKDKAFETPVNSICGYISSMMSNYLPSAVNKFLSLRTSCLSVAKDEHQAHIDFALGIDRGKEQIKDLGR